MRERSALLTFLKKEGINAVFHYLPLHSSDFFRDKHDGRILPNTDHFSDCIIRLPFYNEMKEDELNYVADALKKFYYKCDCHEGLSKVIFYVVLTVAFCTPTALVVGARTNRKTIDV